MKVPDYGDGVRSEYRYALCNVAYPLAPSVQASQERGLPVVNHRPQTV